MHSRNPYQDRIDYDALAKDVAPDIDLIPLLVIIHIHSTMIKAVLMTTQP
jgi:hypothetical protein